MNQKVARYKIEEVKKQYRLLLEACRYFDSFSERKMIRLAFNDLLYYFRDHLRPNGDPYFMHAVSVARIVTEEMDMDAASVIASLLMDIPGYKGREKPNLEESYGKTISGIVQNVCQIAELNLQKVSLNSENFIQLLLTMSGDIRVILIRLADRLNLMRMISRLPQSEQLQVSEETSRLYAPLAHRLGLYNIKAELEELSMKHSYPDIYQGIARKIEETREEQNHYFRKFIEPINKELTSHGLDFEIKYRTKSIPSIWNKMRKQNIDFEQVYDFFAIRIILRSAGENEKADCWKAYSLVTNIYAPNPARLRDWISAPKSNGYESLHTTVTGDRGKWIEVQIRSERMDKAAEQGRAAHWKYKGAPATAAETAEKWLNSIRSILENYTPGEDELDCTARMELFSDYVYAFTPQGDLKKLKAGATVLDFAFEVHSDIGQHCNGAKVNGIFVPLKQPLRTGDKVEIVTSRNQRPNKDWLSFATTSKAIAKIRRALKELEFSQADTGKGIVQRKLNQLKINYTEEIVNKLVNYYKADSSLDLFHGIAEGKYDVQKVREAMLPTPKPEEIKQPSKPVPLPEVRPAGKMAEKALIIIHEDTPLDSVKFARCCHPVFGDEIFGFVTVTEGIKIHRTSCTNAPEMHGRYAYRIVPARWAAQAETSAYVATLKIIGDDQIGILNAITDVITRELNANIRSVNLNSHRDKFEGTISVNVGSKAHLDLIIARLSKMKGIRRILREK